MPGRCRLVHVNGRLPPCRPKTILVYATLSVMPSLPTYDSTVVAKSALGCSSQAHLRHLGQYHSGRTLRFVAHRRPSDHA